MDTIPVRSAPKRTRYVLSSLAGFYAELGAGDPPLVAPLIEAYCLVGLPERHSSTKGTYRSVLRQLSDEEPPKGAPRFPGSRARVPYSSSERAELWSIARSQRTVWRSRSCLGLMALSMGAGLRTREVVAARREDVEVSACSLQVRVRGELSRVVAVNGESAEVLRRLARGRGGEYLFHPEEADRSYANFVNDFCHHTVASPSAPKLSVGRCRSSFVCDHLENGTKLSELLTLTGIVEVESLLYYSLKVNGAPHTKAALRAAQAGT